MTATIDNVSPEDVAKLQKQMRAMMNKPSSMTPVEFVSAMDIQPKKVEWLVPNLIPKGMISILAGKAGEGKTNIALWLASLVSNQSSRFNGKPIGYGKVLIWSGEDTAEYVLVPRLRAFGADMRQIEIVGNKTLQEDGTVRPFDISKDVPDIERSIVGRGGVQDGQQYVLLIIDPIVSTVRGDMNQANNVRQALEPLRELAERQGIAVLGITHFSKGSSKSDPQERVIGSQAFAALSRMTLGLARDELTDNRRLVILKTNITDDKVGYEFSYEYTMDADGCGVPRIELLRELQGNARELLSEIEPEEVVTGAVAEAMGFLKGILHDGSLTSKQVEAEAKGAGHSWDSIRKAAKKLNVEKRKDTGSNGKWRWALPSE